MYADRKRIIELNENAGNSKEGEKRDEENKRVDKEATFTHETST